MAMKMLEAGGMSTIVDGIRTADEDNPKGYYEDERVKDLAEMEDKSWLAGAKGKAIKVISYLLKDLPESHNYKVLFMRRDYREVLASQAKMLDRRGEASESSDKEMREVYTKHLETIRFQIRFRPQFESLDIQHRRVIENPREQAERIVAFLGSPLDVEKMAQVVDEQLYRNRAR